MDVARTALSILATASDLTDHDNGFSDSLNAVASSTASAAVSTMKEAALGPLETIQDEIKETGKELRERIFPTIQKGEAALSSLAVSVAQGIHASKEVVLNVNESIEKWKHTQAMIQRAIQLGVMVAYVVMALIVAFLTFRMVHQSMKLYYMVLDRKTGHMPCGCCGYKRH